MKSWTLLIITVCIAMSLGAFSLDMRNRLIVTNITYFQKQTDQDMLGFLWQPEFNMQDSLSQTIMLKGQAMGEGYVQQIFRPGQDNYLQRGKIERLWLSVGTAQTQARIGLQRINFGSAQILRPLQWFDTLDPTDKLEQTEGVQALLLSRYELNNANFWLWAIRGDGKQRGEMPTATKEGTLELGGRMQFPFSNGEFALSFTRMPITTINGQDSGLAGRLGFDTKLDFRFGLWLEGYLSLIEKYPHPDTLFEGHTISKLQAPVTLGVDYTWSVGNGIYTLGEAQLWAETGSPVRSLNRKYVTYAFTANYPLNILDSFLYYGIMRDDGAVSSQNFIWRRKYDRLSWDLAVFWDAGKLHKTYNSRGIKALISYTF
jgi:hypothetical protein